MPNPDFRTLIDPARLFGNKAQPAQPPAKPAAPAQPALAPAAPQTQLTPVDQNQVSQRGSSVNTAPLVLDGHPAAVAFPNRQTPAQTPAPAPANKTTAPAQPARTQTTTQTAAPAPQAAPPAPSPVDNRAAFFNGNAATGKEIDGVLSHYGSPHAGQGELMARICREENINPILMISVMQQESSYGNINNRPSLKPENIANPWSVHFNEGAKGIAKLRLKDGSMPSFEQSLRGAIRTMKNLAGNSPTPLTEAGKRYSETGTWTAEVGKHFDTQSARIAGFRGRR